MSFDKARGTNYFIFFGKKKKTAEFVLLKDLKTYVTFDLSTTTSITPTCIQIKQQSQTSTSEVHLLLSHSLSKQVHSVHIVHTLSP